MSKFWISKALCISILCCLCIIQMGYAWQGVDIYGVSITTAANSQQYQKMVSDEQGGAIMVWMDNRIGTWDIYAQAIDTIGAVKWASNGIAVCTTLGNEYNPQIISDGQSGAIITWQDNRSGSFDIYAQAIDSTGTLKWLNTGIAICTAASSQQNAQIISDGQGGAIITWEDYRNASTPDIYAQSIDSTGTVKWTTNGISISTTVYDQYQPQLVSDGQGGAIITWTDNRVFNDYNIYAQAVDNSGTIKWTLNGVAVCTAINEQWYPQILTNDHGGAIITWQDYRNDKNYRDIYGQSINSTGIAQWTLDGIPVCTNSNTQQSQKMISDGQGGAIICWEDQTNGFPVIYAQAVDSSGTIKWTLNGVRATGLYGYEQAPQIISDGNGGAIITWEDNRNSATGGWDIYAQAFNSSGVAQWGISGAEVCVTATYNHQLAPQIVSDGHGGSIISWQDNRNGNYDIYAQSLDGTGLVPVELSGFAAE